MLKKPLIFLYVFHFLLLVGMPTTVRAKITDTSSKAVSSMTSLSTSFFNNQSPVKKKVLANGMTILVREVHAIPKVSVQLWYEVGSKNEKSGEKGIAHLIEHMIFKGTKGQNSLNLSESDINIITHKLSGSTNAFTGKDYTGYRFDFPTQNWPEALKIMADCMQNCSFEDDKLNSEMKAVIQELKMRRDQYDIDIITSLFGDIFSDHPYHYPIIGYKQDLWSVNGSDLMKFYKKHYGPQNATLVVVGDVEAEDVFKKAEKYFGSIEGNVNHEREEFYHNKDIAAKSITLYRDIQQPKCMLAFAIPGSRSLIEPELDVLSCIMGQGKGSRLYKKLINEHQLATSVGVFAYTLFEHSVFFIIFEPKDLHDVPQIEKIIFDDLEDLRKNGPSKTELERAIKKAQISHFSILEDTQEQAHHIALSYLITGDENNLFTYLSEPAEKINQKIIQILNDYFRPAVAHRGAVLPLPEREHAEWAFLQNASDKEDQEILSARERTTQLDKPHYATQITAKDPQAFVFPRAQKKSLENGITMLYHHNDNVPKIQIALEFKARKFYDSETLPGLYEFMTTMLTEGTENYSSEELTAAIEERGMSLDVSPGVVSISLLAQDLPFALEILNEIVTKPTFPEHEIEKIRSHMEADLRDFWDSPSDFSKQLIRDLVYKKHPYGKAIMGTFDSIAQISRKDLVDFFKKYISPHASCLVIVGAIEQYNIPELVKEKLGSWQGPMVEDLVFPALHKAQAREVDYPISRDQVVLCFAGLSIERAHPDYDKFLLFDQIFGGGVLQSMHSILFKLREQSGLFYTIGGSLLSNVDKQPGLAVVKTIVSLDRLQEAEKAITHIIDTASDKISADDVEEARLALVNYLTENFESNSGIAATFLSLERFGLPADYFDTRNAVLKKITVEQIQEAVRKVLNTKQMFMLRIGRVGETGQ